MYLRYLVAWFPMIILAFANATIHEAVYKRYVGELAAHQISTLTLGVLVGIYVWVLTALCNDIGASRIVGHRCFCRRVAHEDRGHRQAHYSESKIDWSNVIATRYE